VSYFGFFGAVLKASDVVAARMLVGVRIEDQQSFTEANDRLATLGYPLVKARLITDLTATGVNRAVYVPPFRYHSLADGLSLVYRGCWFAKGDVSRYFDCFPLALQSRSLFRVHLPRRDIQDGALRFWLHRMPLLLQRLVR